MSEISQEKINRDAYSLHSDYDMAHIYVIDCGVNDSRYNVCAENNDKNDNIEFKLRVQRNKQKPQQTLVNGRDLEQVIKNTLIPTNSSLSSHTPCQSRKMQYILQFANGRVVLPNEMLRDGDAVEVHRYFLQRKISTKDTKKTKYSQYDNTSNKKSKLVSNHTQQSKQRQQRRDPFQHYNVLQGEQISNINSIRDENKVHKKRKCVILRSDRSDDDDNGQNINVKSQSIDNITTNSNDSDSNKNESVCSNSKTMHTARYIDALRQQLAATRNTAQQLDDEVENEKRVLRDQTTRTSRAIKHEVQQKLHTLYQQLANLQNQFVRIKAMQNRTRCATSRILDKMKNAQTSIDHDIVLLDNEMHTMLRIWQKCVDANLAAKYKQTGKVSGKRNDSQQSLTNERATLQAQGIILCRQLIASVAHTSVRQMRQKLQHEWNGTRQMQAEQVGKICCNSYSTLPQSQSIVNPTDNPSWPFTVQSTHVVKVIARLRAPRSQLHTTQHQTTSRKGVTSSQGKEVCDDVSNGSIWKASNKNNEVKHKWSAAWGEMQTSSEYNVFVNEGDASIQVHVPTKGVRTFALNSVYGPSPSQLQQTTQKQMWQVKGIKYLYSCNSSNNQQFNSRTQFAGAVEKQKYQLQQKQQQQQQQQQRRIFAQQLLPLILQLLFCANKHCITVIAYGASGSGKSYTLLGNYTDVNGQCNDKIEIDKEQSKDDDAKSSANRSHNQLRACQFGGKDATQRGITTVDSSWVVNINQNVKEHTSNHKSEKMNVSAYSTAWQSVTQNAINSRKAMLSFKQQITKQLSSNTYDYCYTSDGLLPQTLQFLLANLQSNRPHSILLEQKCQIAQIGMSACTIERTCVHDLFTKSTQSDNNHQWFTDHKAHKNSNTIFSSSSPSFAKTFTTKLNRQYITLQSLNVTSISDIAAIMNKLKCAVKCGRHERSTCKAEQTEVTSVKDESCTTGKDKMQNNHSKQRNKNKIQQQKQYANVSDWGANGNHHLLVVLRCTFVIHDDVNNIHVQQHKLQSTQCHINVYQNSKSGTSTKQVQMFFVEVAAGIGSNDNNSNSNNNKDGTDKSTNKQQPTRTLTSIGNILYALNHSTSLQQKHEIQHEAKQTGKLSKLLCHVTSGDDRSSGNKCTTNNLHKSNNNTSLSLIKQQTSRRPLHNQSIFHEDPGKWWDVLQPFHGMSFTRVAPIIQQTQLLGRNNSHTNVSTASVTPTLTNVQQQAKSKGSASFAHSLLSQNNNKSSSSQNLAHSLSATQRSILTQGYAKDTLTQLIRDGLTGNSRVLLLACLKPCVPCEVQLVTEDAKPLTLPSPHTDQAIEQIKEIIMLLYNIQAPQMSA